MADLTASGFSACPACGTATSNAAKASRVFIEIMAPVLLDLRFLFRASAIRSLQLAETNAITRSGLPEPFWIFRGDATMTAPVGGS